MEKIKVGIVNYLNTRPLLYGLEKPPINELIEIKGDYPARVAEMLVRGEVDVALVPVAVLADLKEYQIVGNYCIGTEGEIASVALFSDVPLQEIESIYLDYQSRTSVALLKYLLREHWQISPEFIPAQDENYRSQIKGTTAGLVIGDRALEQRSHSKYIFDLGSAWKEATGLPFVFAVWASLRPLPAEFIRIFDAANALGLRYIDEIVDTTFFISYDLKKYFTLHLSYFLDIRKRQGLALFRDILS